MKTENNSNLFEELFHENFHYDISRVYKALAASTDEYIYICNLKKNMICYSLKIVEELDLPGQIISDPLPHWKKIIHPDDWDRFYETNIETMHGRSIYHIVEFRAKNRKGVWIWLQCRGTLLFDENGKPDFFAGFITNLGRRNKIDSQTGLLDQYEFERYIRSQIKKSGVSMAVAILGIDNFKLINERYGRKFGDLILRAIAQKIQSTLTGNASLYRMDGDQFGLIVINTDQAELSAQFERLKEVFARQQMYEGNRYFCTLSGGCAFYPQDSNNYEDLFRFAEYALDHSKRSGKNTMTFFSAPVFKNSDRIFDISQLLRESIEQQFRGFSLVFQPQFEAETKQVKGMEALLRWHCDKYDNLSPAEFVPMMEKTGLIKPLGKWIFVRAVETAKRWMAVCPDLTVSINLSYVQFEEEGLESFIQETLQKIGVPYANIIIELTETSLASNFDNVERILRNLRALGIQIAIDDFGTGYSSLSILKELPINIVKIDRAFVKKIQNSRFDAIFIQYIVSLCHELGVKVCVEGVETADQYEIVKGLGVDSIQGFLFGRPLPEEDAQKLYLSGKKGGRIS